MELAGLSDYVSQFGNSYASSADIKITDLYKYLMNPQAHIKQIRNASTYLTNRHGILKDVLRMVQSLPTLKYNLIWSNYDDVERNKKHEKKVQDFLDDIDVVQVLRDGLLEISELGTIVTCLRNRQYVQFLDLDDIVIREQRNGKWIVEFDFKTLDSIRNMEDKMIKINSLPNEVTVQSYNAYRNSNDKEKDRYVEISNCHVLNIGVRRGQPFGLPLTLGAWQSILQKEVINKVERSVSNRLLQQILVLQASHIDKEQTKPVPKEVLQAYFREVSKIITKKDDGRIQKNEGGNGLIALPHFLELDTVKMDTTLFKEELYSKMNNDIYQNLGVSPSLLAGLEGNYASANVNHSKFFSYITTILEQFETVLNDYIKMVLPKNQRCKLVLDRTTILEKESEIEKFKEFYQQTGVIEPWLNAIFGSGSLNAMINQSKYEKETLDTATWFTPPLNAHTSSGKDLQNPNSNPPSNENTEKSKTDNNNNTPRAAK
ncbi:hypothetical protein [Virgibacillus profundi]|nr:hypothetical protein [Virgibacillus profundi]